MLKTVSLLVVGSAEALLSREVVLAILCKLQSSSKVGEVSFASVLEII